MRSRPLWYDMNGQPLDDLQEVDLLLRSNERVLARDCLVVGGEDVEVSTVFLVIDHRISSDGPPLLWETMVFGGTHDQAQWRYATRTQAEVGHRLVLEACRRWDTT